jgi:hypothetical protein
MSVTITEKIIRDGKKIIIFEVINVDTPDNLYRCDSILDKSVEYFIGDKPILQFGEGNKRIVMLGLDDISNDWFIFQSYIRDLRINNLLNG